MDLVSRVQGILLKPKDEWLKIKDEPTNIQQLFTKYAVILAAIPAVAQFIGTALFVRIPFSGGYLFTHALVYAIFSYVIGLAEIFGVGFIINTIAPSFKSTQNLPNAMKLVVYSMTPFWLAGILYLIPSIGLLALLGLLYVAYLLYLGFNTPLMGTPKEEAGKYFVVSLGVILVVLFIIGAILAAAFSMRGILRVF